MKNELALQNREAWQYRVYEWRNHEQGTPAELAQKIKADPSAYLRCHANLFSEVENKRIANICGSDGQRAVALALLGAEPTVFDISAPQKKYALELAEAAGVKINYETGDFCSTDKIKYFGYFDKTYSEGGILHYFNDMECFFDTIFTILRSGGQMILSDYHPFQKTIIADPPVRNIELTHGNYFDDDIHNGHVPYAKFFSEQQQAEFPSCQLRFYTIGEILNAMAGAGFVLSAFYEHPKKDNPKLPGEFTLIATKP